MTDAWRDEAECRSRHADPRLFDDTLDRDHDQPVESPEAAATRHAHALRYCDACPVVVECLTDALASDDVGVRGGRVFVEAVGRSSVERLHKSRQATALARRHLKRMQGAA